MKNNQDTLFIEIPDSTLNKYNPEIVYTKKDMQIGMASVMLWAIGLIVVILTRRKP